MYRATVQISGAFGGYQPGELVDAPESVLAAWLATGIIERTEAAPAAGSAVPHDLTFKDLSALAAEHGIKVKVGTKKADLLAAIQAVTEDTYVPEPAPKA